jgi:hypothetical protein
MTYIPTDLRRLIIERAVGCCEYCRVPESGGTVGYHVEHVIAIAHGGQTSEDNLAYSCPTCNRYKGSNIAAADPETGDPTFLFHPRRHEWDDHFTLQGVIIESLTPEGRATEFVLRLNESDRLEHREILFQSGRFPC